MINEVGGTLIPGSRPGGCPPDQHWAIPLLIAILIHVAVAAMAMLAPALSPRRAVLPEIYTVNLFSAVEATPPAPMVKPAEPARREPAPPPPILDRALDSAPVKKEVVAPPQAAAKEPPISERPIRSKTPSDEAKLRDLRAKMTAQDAREKQKVAEREIEKALADIRNLHKNEVIIPPVQTAPSPPAPTARPAEPAGGGMESSRPAATGGSGQGAIVEKIMRRYLADLHMRIQQHWKLPDLQSWDNSLEARFVIKVRRDGIVTESFFENRSQNFQFDRFVEKAIRDASPLPPFPPGLEEDRLEIGLRFRPGEVF